MTINQSRDPLLYILQPDISYPKADMQQTYVTKKKLMEEEKSKLDIEETKKNDRDKENSLDTIEKTEVENQDTKNLSDEEGNQKKNNRKGQKGKKEDLHSEEVQKVINEYQQDNKEVEKSSSPFTTKKQQAYSLRRVKSFKEMDTEERLNYLIHFPKQLPPVPCVFVTKTTSVRGFLLKKTDEIIEIKQFNDKVMEISMDDLMEVKMIGLR